MISCWLILGALAQTLTVNRLFSNGAVLQREQPIAVWGTAASGAIVTVAIDGVRVRTRANASGTWRVSMPPHHPGGPYVMRIVSGHDTVRVNDVLIGDVWLASGQSNMEWPVGQSAGAADAIAHADENGNAKFIREFKLPVGFSYHPEDTLAGGEWAHADAAHLGDFSAVAYFFARALRTANTPGPRVPIGIVNSTWGGSAIEAWLGREAQGLSATQWGRVRDALARTQDSLQRVLRERLGTLPQLDSGYVESTHAAPWAAPQYDDRTWSRVAVPGYWESAGYPALDGTAWYRTTFTLTAADAAAGATLQFAAIDDDDITWVNGREVGRTNGYNVPRRYVLPAAVLHAGTNTVAVRVGDGAGGGGINGNATLRFADGREQSLAGAWAFRVGRVSFQPDGQVINKVPAVLYNRMMRPLALFAVRGVLWYQGESNANNDAQARSYRRQFTQLISSWRRDRRAPALPFLWVQLPNYGAPDSAPPRSAGWALLRESMSSALSLPATGEAVIIDLGDADDIHPRNKHDVGERLARVARRVAYGASLESGGPQYATHTRVGDSLVVRFTHVAAGLRSSESITGFAIAGADRHWVWAEARRRGNRVVVWHPGVKTPVATRYAWSNGPVRLTLRNSLDLPAAPFRTDRW